MSEQPYKGPTNLPCSACSDGDTAMQHHDHDYVRPEDRRQPTESVSQPPAPGSMSQYKRMKAMGADVKPPEFAAVPVSPAPDLASLADEIEHTIFFREIDVVETEPSALKRQIANLVRFKIFASAPAAPTSPADKTWSLEDQCADDFAAKHRLSTKQRQELYTLMSQGRRNLNFQFEEVVKWINQTILK